MSDDHAHAERVEEIERIETVSSTKTPWGVRLGLAIGGLVLLMGAFVAWQFRGSFSGPVSEALPWVIAAALVLGAGAILETITVEIWLALIIGAVAVVIAFIVVGSVVVYPTQGGVYVVERFTGEVEFCTPDLCKVLPRMGTLQPQLHK
jgi:hypothetical protein